MSIESARMFIKRLSADEDFAKKLVKRQSKKI